MGMDASVARFGWRQKNAAYDQMHLVHDFEAFTGETPTKTLDQLMTLFHRQIEASRTERPFRYSADDQRWIL